MHHALSTVHQDAVAGFEARLSLTPAEEGQTHLLAAQGLGDVTPGRGAAEDRCHRDIAAYAITTAGRNAAWPIRRTPPRVRGGNRRAAGKMHSRVTVVDDTALIERRMTRLLIQ